MQAKDLPLAAWIAAGGFDVVLLPARRRPVPREDPAIDQLRKSKGAEVRVVDAGSSFDGPRIGILASPLASSDPR